jgi:IclR family transcriptional regulator, acetate operon repressor
MKTVDKAMTLLGLFSRAQPEIGLSELGRLAGFDKAATRRFLVALAKHGFIEQNSENKRYRLGSAFLHFARLREAALPLSSIVQPVLTGLALETGETAHASILSGTALSTIAVAEPQRATRAYVDPSQPLPLYATASGLVCLAYAPRAFLEDYLAHVQFKRIAPNTLTSKKSLKIAIGETFARGFGRADRSFGEDVVGTAAPIFDQSGHAVGAIAVAAVATRVDAGLELRIARSVVEAAIVVTRAMGGLPHEHVHNALREAAA